MLELVDRAVSEAVARKGVRVRVSPGSLSFLKYVSLQVCKGKCLFSSVGLERYLDRVEVTGSIPVRDTLSIGVTTW